MKDRKLEIEAIKGRGVSIRNKDLTMKVLSGQGFVSKGNYVDVC